MIPEISDGSMEIFEKLSFLRLGMVLVHDVMPPEEKEAGEAHLMAGLNIYLNSLSTAVNGEEFTMEETKRFAHSILEDLNNPFEAGYFLQKTILSKTQYRPELFRDPDPLRTIKDVRGMTDTERDNYLDSLKNGMRIKID